MRCLLTVSVILNSRGIISSRCTSTSRHDQAEILTLFWFKHEFSNDLPNRISAASFAADPTNPNVNTLEAISDRSYVNTAARDCRPLAGIIAAIALIELSPLNGLVIDRKPVKGNQGEIDRECAR